MNNDILLSVVIVSWNTKIQTTDCLDSIVNLIEYKQNPKNFEIIVIDNNSADGTVSEIAANYKTVHLIKNSCNVGYAPACNQGMRAAKGKYVLLLGSDTVIKDYSLQKCIEFLEHNAKCGAVGCKLIFPNGEGQGSCKKFPSLNNAFFTYLSLNNLNKNYDMLWFNYDKTIEVDQIATTFMMARNEILSKIDYFDERYRILYNDVDLCKKIWDSCFKIYFLHTAEIIHHGSFSTKKADFKIRKIMYEDIFLYFRNQSGIFAVALLPILYLRLVIVSLVKTLNVFNR
jgi:hypothetical protein